MRRATFHVRTALAGLLAAAAPLAGCTETPGDLPECVGPGSYCPSEDAGADARPDAASPGGDAGQDAATEESGAQDAGNG